MTHPQEGGTGGEVSEILFFSAKSKRRPSLIYSMQIIPVCLSIVARRKGVSATRRGGLNWTPISLLVGHPCKLFHNHCGAQTRAVFPEDVTAPTQYGDGVAVHAAYLQTLHCIPEKRPSQMFLDIYGIRISAATLARLIAKKAKEMFPFAEAVKDLLSGEQTTVKHLDETGLRVAGKTRWIHVLCSVALSYFRLGVSRG